MIKHVKMSSERDVCKGFNTDTKITLLLQTQAIYIDQQDEIFSTFVIFLQLNYLCLYRHLCDDELWFVRDMQALFVRDFVPNAWT